MLDEAVRLAFPGARTACYVEWEGYAQAALLARMEEKSLEPAPVWGDSLESFPAEQFAGRVDWVSAGFPCQPHSLAGRRKGVADERWIWEAIAEIIRRVGPRFVFLENVRGLLSSSSGAAFGKVLRDLAEIGFNVEWTVLRASDVGAAHQRARLFIMAHRPGERLGKARPCHPEQSCRTSRGGTVLANGESDGRNQRRPEPSRIERRSDAAEYGSEMANPADSFRSRGGDRKDEMGLDQQARRWATPTASANSNRTARIAPSHGETHGMILAGQAAAWPPPAARDAKGANSRAHVTGNGTRRMHLDQLPNFVAHAFSHPDPIPTCGEKSSPPPHTSHQRLNPAFVSWLMGWPWWWTRTGPMPFAAREMEWFRSRLQRHLDTFLEE